MELITSMFTIVNNVSDTDRQYKLLSKKLQYSIQKSDHLLKQTKIDAIPSFVLENLKQKTSYAKEYLDQINSLLTSKSIPLKQKIKLSLPFNKTSQNVKTAINQLQGALQDVKEHTSSTVIDFQQKQPNGKRSVRPYQSSQSDRQKEQQRQLKKKGISMSNEEIDEGLQQQIMGDTVQQDQAIQFTKNKYIYLTVQLMGKPQIIELIKSLSPELLYFKKKQLIKFQNEYKKDKPNQKYLRIFSLTRIYFKPIYSKLKAIYPDVDRISKLDHFVVSLKRSREHLKQEIEEPSQVQQKQSSQKIEGEQFFSFPDQPVAVKQKDQIVISRAIQKSLHYLDMGEKWQRIQQIQRLMCNGDRIATFIPFNKDEPELYFKIKFNFTQ